MLFQSHEIVRCGKVAHAGVWQKRNNQFTGILGPFRKYFRRMHRRSGRNADHQAFGTGQFSASRVSVFVLDGEDLVEERSVERIRHKTGADALQLVRARFAAGKDRRRSGLHGNYFNTGLLFFQVLRNACYGSAGADARNKNIDFAVGLLPDFRPGRFLVRFRVRRVDKLARE